MISMKKKAIVSDINQHHEKNTILTFCAVKDFFSSNITSIPQNLQSSHHSFITSCWNGIKYQYNHRNIFIIISFILLKLVNHQKIYLITSSGASNWNIVTKSKVLCFFFKWCKLLLLVWITYNLFKERKTRRKKFFHENVLIKSVHIKVQSDWKR